MSQHKTKTESDRLAKYSHFLSKLLGIGVLTNFTNAIDLKKTYLVIREIPEHTLKSIPQVLLPELVKKIYQNINTLEKMTYYDNHIDSNGFILEFDSSNSTCKIIITQKNDGILSGVNFETKTDGAKMHYEEKRSEKRFDNGYVKSFSSSYMRTNGDVPYAIPRMFTQYD